RLVQIGPAAHQSNTGLGAGLRVQFAAQALIFVGGRAAKRGTAAEGESKKHNPREFHDPTTIPQQDSVTSKKTEAPKGYLVSENAALSLLRRSRNCGAALLCWFDEDRSAIGKHFGDA